ncbi:hypothetical protein BC943DRAFT_357965 [Umbelopsis sp. AD052]|nr:hypothetical protein BC943DRAFT_357965 [Umbelopsis sp. AD052]
MKRAVIQRRRRQRSKINVSTSSSESHTDEEDEGNSRPAPHRRHSAIETSPLVGLGKRGPQQEAMGETKRPVYLKPLKASVSKASSSPTSPSAEQTQCGEAQVITKPIPMRPNTTPSLITHIPRSEEPQPTSQFNSQGIPSPVYQPLKVENPTSLPPIELPPLKTLPPLNSQQCDRLGRHEILAHRKELEQEAKHLESLLQKTRCMIRDLDHALTLRDEDQTDIPSPALSSPTQMESMSCRTLPSPFRDASPNHHRQPMSYARA